MAALQQRYVLDLLSPTPSIPLLHERDVLFALAVYVHVWLLRNVLVLKLARRCRGVGGQQKALFFLF